MAREPAKIIHALARLGETRDFPWGICELIVSFATEQPLMDLTELIVRFGMPDKLTPEEGEPSEGGYPQIADVISYCLNVGGVTLIVAIVAIWYAYM